MSNHSLGLKAYNLGAMLARFIVMTPVFLLMRFTWFFAERFSKMFQYLNENMPAPKFSKQDVFDYAAYRRERRTTFKKTMEDFDAQEDPLADFIDPSGE